MHTDHAAQNSGSPRQVKKRHRCELLIWHAICASLLFSTAGCRSQDQVEVVAVRSLEDSGPGTLRSALKSGNRRIEFKVGGEIELKQSLVVTVDNVIIDGTGAPHPECYDYGETIRITWRQRGAAQEPEISLWRRRQSAHRRGVPKAAH